MKLSRTTTRLALAAALAFLSTTALAYYTCYTQTVDGIEWTYWVSGDTASLGGDARAVSTNTTGAIVIPSTLGGYPVRSIGHYAFYCCRGLTRVTIPDSVTSIRNYAFWECSGLTSVRISDSATSIRNNAFQNCRGLTSVTIPDSVTRIEDAAFMGCSGLKTLHVPAGWKERTEMLDSADVPEGCRIVYGTL